MAKVASSKNASNISLGKIIESNLPEIETEVLPLFNLIELENI